MKLETLLGETIYVNPAHVMAVGSVSPSDESRAPMAGRVGLRMIDASLVVVRGSVSDIGAELERRWVGIMAGDMLLEVKR